MRKLIDKVQAFANAHKAELSTILPSVLSAILIINSNSSTCWILNQPEAPKSLKKYRKF